MAVRHSDSTQATYLSQANTLKDLVTFDRSVKKGLEIASIALTDVKNHTAFHLFVVQTILQKEQSLMGFYVSFLLENVTNLLLLSPYLAVDSYFAKTNFITPLTQKGFHII